MTAAAEKRSAILHMKWAQARRIRGHRTGSLVGRDDRGTLVDYPGNPHGPLVARTTVPIGALVADHESSAPLEVLLVFEHERSDEPIIVGLLEPKGPAQARTAPAAARTRKALEAKIDGRRVVLEAEDEIELRCGEATITLRRNGRVVIRGTYVETRSRGVNRIKGGAVQIN